MSKLHLRLTPKLILLFVLFAAVLLALMGLLAYSSGRAGLEAAATSELLSIAVEKEAALTRWVKDRQSDLTTLSVSPQTQADLATFISAAPESSARRSAHDHLIMEWQPRTGKDLEFLSVFVIDPADGKVIAATNPSEESLVKKDRPYFVNGKTGLFVQNPYYSPELHVPMMVISAPVLGDNGQLLAVLAGRLNLDEMSAIISRHADAQQTSDAFLINTTNLFVTQPRFISDPVVLQQSGHTEAVMQCLTGQSGTITYNDYRNVPAIAVYRWLPERQLCLIVKVDQAEAFSPVNTFGVTIVGIIGLLLVFASLFGAALARSLTRPILALQTGVVRFGQGELEVRLPETSHDELGLLAHEFNRMASALAESEIQLRSYAAHLEQKVAERTAALSTSQVMFQNLFEVAPDAVVVIDREGYIARLNAAAERLFNYGRDELYGQSIEVLIPERFRSQHIEQRTHYSQQPFIRAMGFGLDIYGRRKDGSEFPTEITLGPLQTEDGPIVLSIIRDITERKQAEETLRYSENMYRTLMEQASDAVFISDATGNYVLVNEQACRMLGYSREELLQLSVRELLVPQDLAATPPRFGELSSGKSLLSERYLLRKDGTQVPVEISAKRLDDGRMQGLVRDITERKQMEQKTQELAAIVQFSDEAIVSRNLEGVITSWNNGATRIYGYSASEMIGKISSLVPADHPNEVRKLLTKIRAGESVNAYETVRQRKDGQIIHVSLSMSPIRDTAGQIIGISTIGRDISERKQMEQKTQELAAIVQFSDEAIVGRNLDGIISSWNNGAEKVYGYSVSEMIGKTISILVPPDRADEAAHLLDKISAGDSVNAYETIRQRKDGQIIHVSLSVSPVRDTTGQIVGSSTIGRDITERKQAEAALRRYTERQVGINRLDRIISSGIEIEQLYDSFVKELVALSSTLMRYARALSKIFRVTPKSKVHSSIPVMGQCVRCC